ncbi:hypothetical protein GDO86_019513 [Hymenochirus boettgeri]|uniref:TIR domain-containing protein n=1 Tax=Hymenochirus boettgeri TaxID=247094 RepID=A0A8T2IPH7_9PIPI|nr:hypothetical protein GDO86_019513 [Hymenochirus boettgeri]
MIMDSRRKESSILFCCLVFVLLKGICSQTQCQTFMDKRYVSCRGLNLEEVPKDLPVTVEHLDLSYNRLSQIHLDDFSTYTHLRALNLSFNNISSIDSGSFNSTILLNNLTLFNNSLTEIPSNVLDPLVHLEFLDISNNAYNSSTLGNVFSTLVNLKDLSVGGSFINKVLKDDFAPIRNISLKRFALKTMSSLGYYESGTFSVLDTDILWFDVALDTNPQALPLILKDLAGKTIDTLRFRNLFEFSYYEETIDIFSGLADIDIRTLIFYRGKFNENLLRLTLQNIEKSSIQDLSLLSVDFARSHQSNKTDVTIDGLYLQNLLIKDVTNPDILRFDWTFTWFSKVTNISIINVNFNSAPCDVWTQMQNVETFDVTSNNLIGSYLYNPLCKGIELPKLNTFIAAQNNFQSLRTISLLAAEWPKLTTLDLRSNFLGASNENCTWTPNITTLILKDNTLNVGVFKCLPRMVEFLDLSHSQLDRLDMDYFNSATNLKVLLLSPKQNQIHIDGLEESKPSGSSFRRKLFCCYSLHVTLLEPLRSDWVRGELLNQLENCNPPYKVCIHERDFLPGKWIIENIIENIENSHKIIFVLSRSFINSEWCNYELYFAHQRAIGHAFEDVILVVKENVTMEDLPKRFCKLRKILKTKTYLEWPLEKNRQQFFWIQLKSILGKANNCLEDQEDYKC